MNKTLICTVGTSFFQGNLAGLSINSHEAEKNPALNGLARAYQDRDWLGLAQEMLNIPPKERVLGAEINTIEFIIEKLTKNGDSLCQVFFLVSDTKDGMDTGQVLQWYYEARTKREPILKGLHTTFWIVEDLQASDPLRFKKSGLLNLVRSIAKGIKAANGANNVIIDATGGYKAQIAIAVMLGQALGIDVIYKHELFSTIIDFPPMPVTLDYSYFDKYNDLFSRFYYNQLLCLSLKEMSEYFSEKIKSFSEFQNSPDFSQLKLFFEIEKTNNEYLFALNHAGLIYIESALQHEMEFVGRFPPRQSQEERKEPRFKNDHYPIGFREYVHRIWERESWIYTIVSLPYDKQHGIIARGFRLLEIGEESMLVGHYKDTNNFGARFRILLGENNEATYLRAAMLYLNEHIEEYG